MIYLLLLIQLLQLAVCLIIFFACGGFALVDLILHRDDAVEDDLGYLEQIMNEQGR